METQNKIQENQISTEDFFKKVFVFFGVLGKNWRLLLIGFTIGALIALISDYITVKKTQYRASITFNLELGSSGSAGQLGGLASALGVGAMGQAQSGDFFSGSNFPKLIQTLVVYEKALMKEVEVNGKKELFINYYIDSSGIKNKEWAGSLFKKPFTEALNYRFTKKEANTFSPMENTIITSLYDKLNPDTVIFPIEGTSLIVISGVTLNENLSKAWVEALMAATEDFYKEVKTKKTKEILQKQITRLDSIKVLLGETDRKLARLTFESANVVDPTGPMKQQQYTRNNTFLSNQYFTQMTTIEQLNRVIAEQTPIFTIVEPARLPLETEVVGSGIDTKLFSLIGLIVATLSVIISFMVKKLLK